jgi:hypothetical protein
MHFNVKLDAYFKTKALLVKSLIILPYKGETLFWFDVNKNIGFHIFDVI